jgi:protease-4
MLRYLAVLLTGLMFLASTPARLPAQTPTPVQKVVVPVIEVGGAIDERQSPFAFLDSQGTTLREMTATVRKAADDPQVGALVIRIDGPGWGFAQASEFRGAIADFRKVGKPVYVFADSLGIGDYVVATAANEVIMPPVGGLDLYGMNFSLYYFKDLLANLGVEADVVNTGRFKDAMEPFVSNEMSEGTRTQFTALLEDLFKSMTDKVAESRSLSPEDAKKLLTEGPYTSKQALERKAIDRVAYLEDFLVDIEKDFPGKTVEPSYEYEPKQKKSPDPPSLMSLIMGGGAKSSKKSDSEPKVALVYALGNIVDGRVDSSNPFSQENVIAGLDFLDLLDEVRDEQGVKAIVLRVDSPGGSAIASDMIWKRLATLRAEGIPIVVSMGNIAASGGYYISMGADKIVAEPTTITGSIGVVGGKFTLGGTYEKIGVKKYALSIGDNVGIYSETTKWNERERVLLNALLDDIYDQFTAKAAEGRGKTQDQIKEIAGGRVWSGLAAKENGLVDQLGGLDDAIELARELGGAPGARVVEFPKELTFMEFIEKAFSGKVAVKSGVPHMSALEQSALFQAAGLVIPPKHLRQALFIVDAMRDKPTALLTMPYAVDIE